MSRIVAGVAIVAASAAAVHAQASQEPTPIEMSMASRIVSQYQYTRSMVTRLVEKMPAEHYGFQPAPDMRPFAASVAHLAMANLNQCSNLLGRRHERAGQDLTKTVTTKDAALAVIGESFVACDEFFTAVTADAALTSQYFSTAIQRDGQRTPAKVAHGAIAASLIAHNSEMYGYLAVYLRLKGIVPPSSEPPPVR